MNLAKKLADWQQQKLISATQSEAILAYENKSHKPLTLFSFLALAIFCIGLGIISLISANWQIIPAGLKLSIDFIFLVTIASTIYIARQKGRELLFEIMLILYAIMIIASIGLVAQIYQIQPDGYTAYFFWAILTAPLLFYTQRLVFPIIWMPVFTASAIDVSMNINLIEKIVRAVERSFPYAISIIGILVLSFIYRLLAIHFRTRLAPLVKSMKFWLVFDIVILVVMMDFGAGQFWCSQCMDFQTHHQNYISIMVVALLIISVAGFGYFSQRYNYSRLLTCVLAVLLGFSLFYMVLPKQNSVVFDIFGFLLTLSCLACLSAYALIKGRQKLLNLSTGLIALRIFIVYLQVFGTLLTTGIGLISSGFVFLGIIYVWRRLHIEKFIMVKEHK